MFQLQRSLSAGRNVLLSNKLVTLFAEKSAFIRTIEVYPTTALLTPVITSR